MKSKAVALALCGLLALVSDTQAAAAKELYQQDFEKSELDSVPDEFLISEGAFAVKQEGGNKFLELPGAPLDSFGFYFGPTEKDNIAVSARFMGTGKGRLRPTYALSLGAGGQFKLRMAPAKKAIELYKGEEVAATVPYDWPSGKWVVMQLQIRKNGAKWNIEGKAWPQGEPEPQEWTITLEQTEEPIAGRPAIWASPYSGTPIQFDDIKFTSIGP